MINILADDEICTFFCFQPATRQYLRDMQKRTAAPLRIATTTIDAFGEESK